MPTPSTESAPTLGKRMMWFVILWLVGFAGTMLLAMPFHFLASMAMKH
ncbi:hypothetical protein P3T18_004370 [Paraburkholderia sp. GAS199]